MMNRAHSEISNVSSKFSQLIPIIAGIILLAAATLKTIEFSFWPSEQHLLSGSKLLTIGAILVETALAGWLFSGRHLRLATACAAILFVVFSYISARRFLSGETDCGCFGSLKVPPLLTTIVDVVLSFCLGRFAFRQPSSAKFSFNKTFFIFAALIGFVIWVGLSFRTAKIDEHGVVSGHGTVVLKPFLWIDKKIPIGPFFEDSKGILDGEWEMLFINFYCTECKKIIRERLKEIDSAQRLAVLELPPFGVPNVIVEEFESVRWLRLRTDQDWFCEVPTVLRIRDGVVIAVEEPLRKQESRR
jgi:hypothetical protein